MKRTSTITQCATVLGCHFKAFPAINQMLSYTLHPPFPNPNSTSPPSTSINHLHPPELHNRVIITTLSSHLAQKHSLITPSAPINSPATSAKERETALFSGLNSKDFSAGLAESVLVLALTAFSLDLP